MLATAATRLPPRRRAGRSSSNGTGYGPSSTSPTGRASAQPARQRGHRRLSGDRRAGGCRERRPARRRDRGVRRRPAVLRAAAERMHVRVSRRGSRRLAATPVTFVAFDVLRRYGVDLTARPFDERRATLERWRRRAPGLDDQPDLRRRAGDRGGGARARARGRGRQARRLALPPGHPQPGLGQAALRARPATSSSSAGRLPSTIRATRARWCSRMPAGTAGLVFAGKVGSGLTGRTAPRLAAPDLVERAAPVVRECPPGARPADHWVEPRWSSRCEFTDWTDEGRLRHPVFLRVRDGQA